MPNKKKTISIPHWIEFLIRSAKWLMIAGIALVAIGGWLSQRLVYRESIESLYAPDDPHLLDFLESKSLFGGDELVMVAYEDDDLFSLEGYERNRKLARELSQIDGVIGSSTQCLADAISPIDVNWIQRLILRTKHDELKELFRGVLLGLGNEKTTAVVLRMRPLDEQHRSRTHTIEEMRRIATSHFESAVITGEPLLVHETFRYVREDSNKLFYVSLVILGGVLMLFFRNPRWVAIPLLIVTATIMLTKAMLVLSGTELSMVSTMLNSLVTIISIATVMHITLHYRELRKDYERLQAFHQTAVEMSSPIFWTTATTMAGFASLLSSRVVPVQSLGLTMSLGTAIVLVSVVLFVPGGALLGRRMIDPYTPPIEKRLARVLNWSIQWVDRYRKRLFWLITLFVVVIAAGVHRLDVETDFSRNFRESSPLVQGLEFVESRMGGTSTWEVNFPAPATLNQQFLDKVRDFAADLRTIEVDGEAGLTKVICLPDTLDMIPAPRLFSNRLTQKIDGLKEFQPEVLPSLYNADKKRMRIILRSRERQPSHQKRFLLEEVERRATPIFPEHKVTGIFVIFTFLIESLLGDQMLSFGISAGAITIMMMIAFRSARIGLISLIPNAFPIILLLGGLGWIGSPINMGTAMIASVSMGLTVDSSIHYLSGYLRARRAGLSTSDALKRTQNNVGEALVFTTFALIAGFSVLTLSQFIPLVYFGLLVSLAMLGGLLGNLVLLPILIRMLKV